MVGADGFRTPATEDRVTESGDSLLEAANVTFEDALDDYLGAAASTGELARLSNTLGRLRRHLINAGQADAQRAG